MVAREDCRAITLTPQPFKYEVTNLFNCQLPSLNVGQFTEYFVALFNLFSSQLLQPLCAERLDGIGAHHSTIKHGPFENVASKFTLRGDIAHETSGKTIASACWISHHLNRQSRRPERMTADTKCAILKKYRRTVFAVLDHQRLWSHFQDSLSRTRQARITGKHFCFSVIDE